MYDTSILDGKDPVALEALQGVVDLAVRAARASGYCDQFEETMSRVLPEFAVTDRNGRLQWFDSRGMNCRRQSLADLVSRPGYDENGYDADGYDRDGYSTNGMNAAGDWRYGATPDSFTFNTKGVDAEGRDYRGFDRAGRDKDGINRYGEDAYGASRIGRPATPEEAALEAATVEVTNPTTYKTPTAA